MNEEIIINNKVYKLTSILMINSHTILINDEVYIIGEGNFICKCELLFWRGKNE